MVSGWWCSLAFSCSFAVLGAIDEPVVTTTLLSPIQCYPLGKNTGEAAPGEQNSPSPTPPWDLVEGKRGKSWSLYRAGWPRWGWSGQLRPVIKAGPSRSSLVRVVVLLWVKIVHICLPCWGGGKGMLTVLLGRWRGFSWSCCCCHISWSQHLLMCLRQMQHPGPSW